MPGTITSALCREIQAAKNVPIVSLFYDGEPGINQRLKVFLAGIPDQGRKMVVNRFITQRVVLQA